MSIQLHVKCSSENIPTLSANIVLVTLLSLGQNTRHMQFKGRKVYFGSVSVNSIHGWLRDSHGMGEGPGREKLVTPGGQERKMTGEFLNI